MKGEELDDYISHFEALVRHAGLAINDQLVVNIFMAGLPHNMYKELYNIQPPLVMYEDWRTAAIEQQKRFIHLKGRHVTFGLHSHADKLDCIVSFSLFPSPKPMYDRI